MIQTAAAPMVPAPLGWPQLAVIIGVVSLALLIWAAFRSRVSRPAPPPAARPDDADVRRPSPTADDLEHASLQLDLKLRRLEHLIQEADRRLEQLANHASDASPTVKQPVSPPIPAMAPETDPLKRRAYELADQGHTPLAIAQQLEEHVGKIELILALRPRSAPLAAPIRPGH